MLVPDFMFRLMMPPRLLPFSASTLFFETVISSTASTAGVYGRLVAGAERHAVEQHVVGAARAAARVVVVRVRVVVRAVLVASPARRRPSGRATPGCRDCGRRSAPGR